MKRKWLHIVLQTFIWLLFVGFFVVSLGFTERQRNDILCQEIRIQIVDSLSNHFLNTDDILTMLREKSFKITKEKIHELPLNEIEKEVCKMPHVKDAQVYTTLDGILHIDVVQRTPMFRLINYNYESYYVDEDGVLFPTSDNYSARVLVVSGNINEPYALYCNRKAYEAEQQDALKRETLLDDIYSLAQYIYHDSLWKAMFEQIYVNENKEFELVPKLGDFIIEFGDTINMESKFLKLREFYRQVVATTGAGEFTKVNVKYKNQIVCKKNIN